MLRLCEGVHMTVLNTIIRTCERKSDLVNKVNTNLALGIIAFMGTPILMKFFFSLETIFTVSRFALLPSLIIPFILQFGVYKMAIGQAQALYYGYAISIGAALSPLLLTLPLTQLGVASLATIGLFGLAIYLSKTMEIGDSDIKILGVGVVILLAVSLLNLFLNLTLLELLICVGGITLCVGLSAYEISNLNKINVSTNTDTNALAVLVSLSLFSKIINIFIYIIRFMRILDNNRNR